MSIVPSSLKVVELRKELSSRGLPTKGKKKDLVKRLDKALAKDQPAEACTGADNLVNEATPNDQKKYSEEKPSEVSSEQRVEPIEEVKPSDKPTEETIQQNIEPSAPTEDLPKASIEIINEQKVEPTLDLLGDKPTDTFFKSDEQTVEPIIETPQPQENNINNDIILSNDTVQIEVIEEPNNQLFQQLSNEGLFEKPQEQFIEKSSEELIEKPQEQTIEKPVGELIEKSLEEIIAKPIEQLISNPLGQFMTSTTDQSHANSQKEDEDLVDHREAVSMIAREQMVTPPKDDLEIKMQSTNDRFEAQDTMMLDEDRGTKRKMNEELHEEPDKKQKITLNDNSNISLLF